MATILFYAGGLLLVGGFAVSLMEYRTCLKIVRGTQGRDDGLALAEIGWRERQFRKWKKLNRLATHDPDPVVQRDALQALRLEVMFYVLLVVGMILLAVGATGQF